MTDQVHDDADELLHWLNSHSVRVSDGVPATLLHQMWKKSGRDTPRLGKVLEWLFQQEMVAITAGLEPPHLRFTPKGYLRLLAAMDNARVNERQGAAAADAKPTRAPASSPMPEAPKAPAPPPPDLTLLQAPSRFLEPGKAPTEIALRNQILFIFRDLQLRAGQQLIAMTLSRYWQEMGLRGGDLRIGIDVLMRDGFLAQAMKRYENHWSITPAGEEFTYAPVTPLALLNLAEPLKSVEVGVQRAQLLKATHALFKGEAASAPFTRLQATFNGSRDLLLHGIDMLWKQQLVELHPSEPLLVSLTAQGLKAKF